MFAVIDVCGEDGWDLGVVTILAWSVEDPCRRRSGDRNEDRLRERLCEYISPDLVHASE